jgi:hypothetical protein
MGKRNHQSVGGVVSSDLVRDEFAARRAGTADACTAECRRQRTALAPQVAVADKSGHQFQGRTDKSVARRVDCQFLEAAKNLSFGKKLPRFRGKNIYPAPDARERIFTMAIASGEIPPQATLNGTGQKPRDQFGNIFDFFVNQRVEGASDARQIRGVQH